MPSSTIRGGRGENKMVSNHDYEEGLRLGEGRVCPFTPVSCFYCFFFFSYFIYFITCFSFSFLNVKLHLILFFKLDFLFDNFFKLDLVQCKKSKKITTREPILFITHFYLRKIQINLLNLRKIHNNTTKLRFIHNLPSPILY